MIVTGKDLSPTTIGDYITFLKGAMTTKAIADMPTPRKRGFYLLVEICPKVFDAATDQPCKDYLAAMFPLPGLYSVYAC